MVLGQQYTAALALAPQLATVLQRRVVQLR
jgi:hypothetical protein